MTSAVMGFSLAVSGMMIEPIFFSSFSSILFTTMLSLSGVIFISFFVLL